MATIALSTIPEFTASVGAPRVAAIEYPFGRPLGQPGDREGQVAVLRATLDALAEAATPGTVVHLPFEWPEPPEQVHWHPKEPSPILKLLSQHPALYGKFLAGEIPE
ncbi:MAG: hypothetical protein ACE5JN_00925 [Candidatus Methylomirabilia bacterium]